ncbi:hypothetical protein BJ684DRAFT_22959 [Piptocephalis cylindrospora]|uniref:DUF155 domain-containing protein n=1 Tax=Piptocephalis cylindrospora TaxID=1907219 RepID=A0A4P9Y4Q5_9FUNG|nr:hypothetical protein BJ684DRAFT_22959 [Piptocephalis cylindrospora]|eukprot:RKP12800.1 hypothetical protein BJ684DRAFT_22959 [Piptocephalis cylindrospora]
MPRSSAKYQQIPTSLSGSRALPDPENPRQVVILPSASSRPIGKQPTRTTKMSHKLAIFPEESEEPLEEVDDDVYNQITQIPLGTARLDAERLKKLDRRNLPRVTAYCTAGIHTPFSFTGRPPALQNASSTSELFIFDYGVIVFWGMEEKEEMRIIRELRPFTTEEIEKDDVETEEFRFHYNSQYQPRIYNDIITLKNPHNYMTKLTISHAIAQSTKLALFERLAELRIEQTAVIPQEMASTGTVHMSRKAITKLIGQLFIVRINVNLVSNVLDTPEIFWSEPALEPLYQAIRGYLEISQRTEIINQRVSVIGDLLEMLKDHLNQKHSTKLEWIIIYVITFETIIGIITVCFDVYHLWD